MCTVSIELLECVLWQDRGPTETISEAPGAYGSFLHSMARPLISSGVVYPNCTGTGPQLPWHINCLELWTVYLSLDRLKSKI